MFSSAILNQSYNKQVWHVWQKHEICQEPAFSCPSLAKHKPTWLCPFWAQDGSKNPHCYCIIIHRTHKGVTQHMKYVTQVQQQRPELPLTWHACKFKVCKLHQRYILWYIYIYIYRERERERGRMYFWWSLYTLYLHVCQVSYCRQLGSLLLYCVTYF